MQQNRTRTASWISAVVLLALSVPFALAQQEPGVEQQAGAGSTPVPSVGDETVDPALESLARPTNEDVLRNWIFAFIDEARELRSASVSASRDRQAAPADHVSG